MFKVRFKKFLSMMLIAILMTGMFPFLVGFSKVTMPSNGATKSAKDIPANASEYQAESGSGKFGSDQTGYTGTGFTRIDYQSSGTSVTNKVEVGSSGTFNVAFRYTAGTVGSAKDRTIMLYVNKKEVGKIKMPDTGAWNNWHFLIQKIKLNKGQNTIMLKAVSKYNGICLDKILLWKNVKKPVPYKIKFNSDSYSVNKDETVKLETYVIYTDETYAQLTSGITYTSSDPSVAKVNKTSGVITGVASGTATITVKYRTMKATTLVTVKATPQPDVTNDTEQNTYTADWKSVDQHNPAPEWFQDAKFGIYFHWGAFSVPAFGNEWYPRWMYQKSGDVRSHHIATYGDPLNWPYQNFINGAYDLNGNFIKFAPKLKSEGGNFDPDEWAQLFYDAGAKFAGPVAEHHDGFSMWDSKVNEWNSMDKGPNLNLASLFSTSIRKKGMKLLLAMHHAYNFTGFYQYVPAQTDPSLQKLYGQLDKDAENQLWYNKLKEVIDEFQPDIIWQDFNLSKVNEKQRLNFLSYYYNKATEWNKEVVATYKYTEAYNFDDGFNPKGEVRDFERGGPANLTSYYWLTDDSVSNSSWSYTNGIGYYSTNAMLHALIDRVSKNGNMLLNISPMADGTIPQGQKDVLYGMGKWLKQYGEAIYNTRAWVKYGEGPTQMGGGSFQTPTEGTAADIRFTRNKAMDTLYAIDLGWPSNNQMLIKTLRSDLFDKSTITGVSLVGGGELSWSQDSSGMKIELPSTGKTEGGVAIKITFSSKIPKLYTSAYDRIEAEYYNSLSPTGAIRTEGCPDGGLELGWIKTGDYAVYNNFYFGDDGADRFEARISGVSTSGKIDIRLDSPDGTLVGTLNSVNTGGWSKYNTVTCNLKSKITGTHDVYLMFKEGLNLNWFDFIK